MQRTIFDDDHEAYRDTVKAFLDRSVLPHYGDWERERLIPREVWLSAGESGLIGLDVAEEFGGPGMNDWRFRYVVSEEFGSASVASLSVAFAVQDDLVLPYLRELATDEQKQRWLPQMVTGERISAIAMSEPSAGSDLQGIKTTAVKDGDGWVLNGSKTFISNGIQADLVVVFARTDLDAGSRGFSLFVVERGMPGFERGRKLDKIGMHAQDTAELFFQDVKLGPEQLLGEEGMGLMYLMQRLPRERIGLAVGSFTSTHGAYKKTLDYVFQRSAFGTRIGDFQNTRFKLAEIETEIDIIQAYLDQAVLALNAGTLTTTDASKAKWFATEFELKATTQLLQLFGGYGFMEEYPLAIHFRDSRVQTIYGGTTEIMKEIISREIAGRYKLAR